MTAFTKSTKGGIKWTGCGIGFCAHRTAGCKSVCMTAGMADRRSGEERRSVGRCPHALSADKNDSRSGEDRRSVEQCPHASLINKNRRGSVYVTGSFSDCLVQFRRDMVTDLTEAGDRVRGR